MAGKHQIKVRKWWKHGTTLSKIIIIIKKNSLNYQPNEITKDWDKPTQNSQAKVQKSWEVAVQNKKPNVIEDKTNNSANYSQQTYNRSFSQKTIAQSQQHSGIEETTQETDLEVDQILSALRIGIHTCISYYNNDNKITKRHISLPTLKNQSTDCNLFLDYDNDNKQNDKNIV
ncbi:hypothetical protein HCN44_000380 [Aphidius gifuensis]|uniref:Uncharacterized protein n=1 Tax=Aphidius gifuensis TaxID=684658 RepID=A0A835CRU2_APHGI|nr:hypothetical protein HCN44_000380 [Aphidius gifuensis]